MMRSWLVADTDADGWAAALDGIDHCFAHTRGFASLMGRAAGTRTKLFVAEGDGCKAVCPIAERSYRGATDVFTPYGFSGFAGTGDLSQLPDAWRAFAQGQGYVAGYIMQHPLAMPGRIADAWPEMSDAGRTLYCVDLTVGEEERLRALSSKKRAQRLRLEEMRSASALRFREDLPQLCSFLRVKGSGVGKLVRSIAQRLREIRPGPG